MDPLTISALVFIAKAAGGISGYTIIGQGARKASQGIRRALEDSDGAQTLDPQLQALFEHIETGALDQAITVWHQIEQEGTVLTHMPVLRELLINALRERRDLARDIAEHGDRLLAQMVQPIIRRFDEVIISLGDFQS